MSVEMGTQPSIGEHDRFSEINRAFSIAFKSFYRQPIMKQSNNVIRFSRKQKQQISESKTTETSLERQA